MYQAAILEHLYLKMSCESYYEFGQDMFDSVHCRDCLGHRITFFQSWSIQSCVLYSVLQAVACSINKDSFFIILPLENIGRMSSSNVKAFSTEVIFSCHSASSERPSLHTPSHNRVITCVTVDVKLLNVESQH